MTPQRPPSTKRILSTLCLVSVLTTIPAFAQTEFAKTLRDAVASPEPIYRPEVRWWLAEGLHTDETLRKNVEEIANSGFGAFEFLAMPERSAPDNIYGWGSDEWTADTRLLIREATKRGLGFSLTSGTHWATANLPDSYIWDGANFDLDNRAASKELDYATIAVSAGRTFEGVLPLPVRTARFEKAETYLLQGVVVAKILKPRPDAGANYAEGSSTGILDFKSLTDISDRVIEKDGVAHLKWKAPEEGQYAIFVYWMHGTGQTASPSVSTNYAVNYMDPYGIRAMTDYWDTVVLTEDLKSLIQANGRGELYMDSLELTTAGAGGILWGYHFKDEFRRRRGYDITRFLPLITTDRTRIESQGVKPMDYQVQDADDAISVHKLRNDVYQTQTDLYLENVLKPLQAWLHSHQMTLRAEPSYGTVMEISRPAKYIDGIEIESFAQNADIDLYRGILGSANIYGRVFSSETGAVRNRNYVYNMDYWTQLAYQQFVGGVTRTVLHGYSAIEGAEGDTAWPGHEGMYARFSERFNSRQPASVHYPAWSRMIARNQKLLRQGRPQRDLAILRTDNAFVNYGVPAHYYPSENSYMMHNQSYFWRDQSLQQAGYTYDYFSAQLLEDQDAVTWTPQALQPNGPAYKAILLYQSALELSAARKLLEIARAGLPVVFVNNTEEVVSHAAPLAEHKKAATLSRFLGESDDDLARLISDIKALPNVREVNDETEAKAALMALGVTPRVGYERPNDKILTISRLDDQRKTLSIFVYAYKSEVDRTDAPYPFSIAVEGLGKPYLVDDWSGEVREVGLYKAQDGRTYVPLSLKPGEARLVVLDLSEQTNGLHALKTTADEVRSANGRLSVVARTTGRYQTQLSDGRTVFSDLSVPPAIPLASWGLTIEDWDAGEKVVNTETRFGHETREVYFRTRKTRLEFPSTTLLPWKDLKAPHEQLRQLSGPTPHMEQVSGIGVYRTRFNWPFSRRRDIGALLDLSSTGGSLASIRVNGKDIGIFNPRTPKVDISAYLKPGVNAIEIALSTTLTNRLLDRGYDKAGSGWDRERPHLQAYGLVGDAFITPYLVKTLQ